MCVSLAWQIYRKHVNSSIVCGSITKSAFEKIIWYSWSKVEAWLNYLILKYLYNKAFLNFVFIFFNEGRNNENYIFWVPIIGIVIHALI